MEQPRTSPATNLSKKAKSGFTLLEIIIALAIVSSIIAIGLPRLNRTSNTLKKTSRELAVLGKEIRNQSRLKSKTHRLVINMSGENHTYYIEEAQGLVAASSVNPNEENEEDDEKSPPPAFQKSTKFFKEDRKLPSELKFKQVESLSQKEPITEGKAYVYFTPEGMVERSAIQIGRSDVTWTILYNPLTGHADIVEKEFSIKDIPKQ
jgi:general secretion pathway protein H